jgi:hypothetical protein
MAIGLAEFRDPKHLKLGWILACPFIGNRSVAPASGEAPDRYVSAARGGG